MFFPLVHGIKDDIEKKFAKLKRVKKQRKDWQNMEANGETNKAWQPKKKRGKYKKSKQAKPNKSATKKASKKERKTEKSESQRNCRRKCRRSDEFEYILIVASMCDWVGASY